MTLFRTRGPALLLALLSCLSLAGCYEDKAEVTVNADGSGTFTQSIRMSEQMVVAMMSEDAEPGMSGNLPFDITRQDVQAKLGDAGTIESFEMTDVDDGGKQITIEGTFADAARFFQSEYAEESLSLRVAVEPDGRATLQWAAQEDEQGMGRRWIRFTAWPRGSKPSAE